MTQDNYFMGKNNELLHSTCNFMEDTDLVLFIISNNNLFMRGPYKYK